VRFLTAFSLASLAILNSHAQGLIWGTDRFAEHSEVAGANWAIAFDHVSDPFPGFPPSLNPISTIFSMTIATNDVGRTFFANAMNEPRFSGFVGGLTDGQNGYLRFQDGSTGAWGLAAEQRFLGRSSLSPDLAGYDITQIGFRVSTFYDYFDPSENRNFRFLGYSLDFYGSPVPEPSTWALLGLGGATAFLLRKKQPPTQRK